MNTFFNVHFHSIFLDAMDKVTAANRNALDFSKAGTYFVPTDHAFNRLGHSRLQRMLSDTTQLTKVYLIFTVL